MTYSTELRWPYDATAFAPDVPAYGHPPLLTTSPITGHVFHFHKDGKPVGLSVDPSADPAAYERLWERAQWEYDAAAAYDHLCYCELL